MNSYQEEKLGFKKVIFKESTRYCVVCGAVFIADIHFLSKHHEEHIK